jgi:Mn2+/Fe2+ NRAMP family transporter
MAVTGVYDPAAEAVRNSMRPLEAAQALTGVLGKHLGRIIFDLGLIGMTCGAISTHMVVCGFTLCEMLGLEYTVWRYRLFTLAPAVGILGVVTTTPMWLPVAASAICFTMLPIAYVTFFIMNNKRSYIGDAVGKGFGRLVFNAILLLAILLATIGAGIQIKDRVIDKLPQLLGQRPRAEAPAERVPSAGASPGAFVNPLRRAG